MEIIFTPSRVIFFITATSIGYLILAIAGTIYFCNRKNKINKFLALYGVLGSIWAILGSFNLTIPIWPVRIILIQMIISSFLGTVFVFFAKAVSDENFKIRKHDALWFIPPIIMTINNCIILLSPELFSSISQSIAIENYRLRFRPNTTLYLHSIFLLMGHIAGGLIIFRANQKEISLQDKKRNYIMMISILIGIIGCFVFGNVYVLLDRFAPAFLFFPVIAVSIIMAGYSLLATQSWKMEYFFQTLKREKQLLNEQFNEIKRISCIDPLTEIFNRKMLYEELDSTIARAHRHNEPASIIMFDIDHFKKINDVHGHLTGDEVLIELADLVQFLIRKSDLLARWGGEEFIALLPHATLCTATELAERIKEQISMHVFTKVERLRCSFGICQYDPSYTQKDFLLLADKALYQAKRHGRDRICVYSEKIGFIILGEENSETESCHLHVPGFS